jgi:CBS domain-containing protein
MFHIFTAEGIRQDASLETIRQQSTRMRVDRKDRTRRSLKEGEGGDRESGGGEPVITRQAVEAYRESLESGSESVSIFHVADVMSRPVVTVEREESLEEAWKRMADEEIRHLPVTDDGRMTGIISDRDILYRTSWLQNEEKENLAVSDLMIREVIATTAVTDIRRVALVMFDNRIRCMPVVSQGERLEGIITRSDILHALVRHREMNFWA